MEETNDQPKVIYTEPTPWYQRKLLWIFALGLITVPLGFYIFKTYFQKVPATIPTQVSSKFTLQESESPIAFNILKNPMIYEWRGSVEGTLVAKDEKSITLANDKNQKITILVDLSPNGTKFFYLPNGPNKTKSVDNYIKLDDIPIGSTLTGEFWIFQGRKSELKGGNFTLVKK